MLGLHYDAALCVRCMVTRLHRWKREINVVVYFYIYIVIMILSNDTDHIRVLSVI